MTASNLADLVRSAAAREADKPALIQGGQSVGWRALDEQIDRAAGALLARGRRRGDRIGLLLGNSLPFAVAYFGALRAGLVAVPLNPAYRAGELEHQIVDAGVTTLIATADRIHDVPEAVDIVAVGGDADQWPALLADAEPYAEPDGVGGGEDLALLLYTSGTSGRPRGAMLSHRALLGNLEQLSRIEPSVATPDDVMLLVLPLFHVYGLNAGLGLLARAGATGVLVDRFDPVETLGLVREHRVTNILGAPPMFVAWAMLPDLADSLGSVRLMVSGAAPLPAGVMTSVFDTTGHRIYEGYGLTETAPVLTTTLTSDVPKPGSIGRPIPGVDLQIRDRLGREVEEDDPGEIVVRGDNLFTGYWPHRSGGPDENGWFRTGDIAYADADGDLYLVDRTRELILVSGFNVYPREVEAVLEQHPDVAEVAVVGIPHPYTGETVKAFVVARQGAAPDSTALIEFTAERLARFKCPTAIEWVDALPHSGNGKVAKGRLRENSAP